MDEYCSKVIQQATSEASQPAAHQDAPQASSSSHTDNKGEPQAEQNQPWKRQRTIRGNPSGAGRLPTPLEKAALGPMQPHSPPTEEDIISYKVDTLKLIHKQIRKNKQLAILNMQEALWAQLRLTKTALDMINNSASASLEAQLAGQSMRIEDRVLRRLEDDNLADPLDQNYADVSAILKAFREVYTEFTKDHSAFQTGYRPSHQ